MMKLINRIFIKCEITMKLQMIATGTVAKGWKCDFLSYPYSNSEVIIISYSTVTKVVLLLSSHYVQNKSYLRNQVAVTSIRPILWRLGDVWKFGDDDFQLKSPKDGQLWGTLQNKEATFCLPLWLWTCDSLGNQSISQFW